MIEKTSNSSLIQQKNRVKKVASFLGFIIESVSQCSVAGLIFMYGWRSCQTKNVPYFSFILSLNFVLVCAVKHRSASVWTYS